MYWLLLLLLLMRLQLAELMVSLPRGSGPAEAAGSASENATAGAPFFTVCRSMACRSHIDPYEQLTYYCRAHDISLQSCRRYLKNIDRAFRERSGRLLVKDFVLTNDPHEIYFDLHLTTDPQFHVQKFCEREHISSAVCQPFMDRSIELVIQHLPILNIFEEQMDESVSEGGRGVRAITVILRGQLDAEYEEAVLYLCLWMTLNDEQFLHSCESLKLSDAEAIVAAATNDDGSSVLVVSLDHHVLHWNVGQKVSYAARKRQVDSFCAAKQLITSFCDSLNGRATVAYHTRRIFSELLGFIHITKSGGTALYNSAYKNHFIYTPNHDLTLRNFTRFSQVKAIVTVIREPTDRFFSIFNYFRYGSELYSRTEPSGADIKEKIDKDLTMNLQQFIAAWKSKSLKLPSYMKDEHLFQQVHWLNTTSLYGDSSSGSRKSKVVLIRYSADPEEYSTRVQAAMAFLNVTTSSSTNSSPISVINRSRRRGGRKCLRRSDNNLTVGNLFESQPEAEELSPEDLVWLQEEFKEDFLLWAEANEQAQSIQLMEAVGSSGVGPWKGVF